MQTKSCELNPIPTYVLKWVLSVLIPLITHIVNASLSSPCFCEELKTSVVRPLLKKKGLDLLEKNYWPVSNLPFLSKLVEWATLAQFDQHCREHQLLPDFQSAYRKGYSTETSLIKMTNDILWSMERKNSYSCHSTGYVCSVWHCRSWSAPWHPSKQVWHNRYCITVVLELCQTPRYEGPYKWCLFIHQDTQLFSSAGKCKWCQPFYSLLCPNWVSNTCWYCYQQICWWPFNKETFQWRQLRPGVSIYLINDGHSCKHSLPDGYYASETIPRQDQVYHVWL